MSNKTIELNDHDFDLDFLTGESTVPKEEVHLEPYRVLIADDDDEMHQATKLLLKNFKFEGRSLVFVDTYTGDETIRVLNEEPQFAVILLDVVMESKVAGLEVVDYLRKVMENHITRIILRTGQPGEAPENKVIVEYDINDYRLKSELTAQRLFTSMYEALRSYRDIMVLEHSRAALARMIKMSANLFSQESIEDLYTCILEQLLCSKDTQPSAFYFRELCDDCGLVFLDNAVYGTIIAATGRYSSFLGKNIKEIPELRAVKEKSEDLLVRKDDVFLHLENGYLISKRSQSGMTSFIYIESKDFSFDIDLIKDYLTNYSSALDNYLMKQEIIKNQNQLINLLVDTIDTRYSDKGNHVKRVGKMGELMAMEIGLSADVVKIIYIASRLHDVGNPPMFSQPLQKYSTESVDLDEFDTIKKAAILAGSQNEDRDSDGYPLGISKDHLITIAEIVYLADTYDMHHMEDPFKELTVEAYKEKANGLFNPAIWSIFEKLREPIQDILVQYADQ